MKQITWFLFWSVMLFAHGVIGQTATFTANPTTGCAIPHTVFFTDQSTSPDTWLWDFGDGSSSTLQNPVHNYTSQGSFQVSLTVTDTITGGTSTAIDSIFVSIPAANVQGIGHFGCAPLTANLQSAPTSNAGIASTSWTLGDGNTSTDEDPTHVYDQPGVYTVSMTVTDNNGCTATETKAAFVQAIGPAVNFGPGSITPVCPPLSVNFTDSTVFGAPIIAWNWSFGDGSTSSLQNPTHAFDTNGLFDVSLTVTDIDGCSRTFTRDSLVDTRDTLSPTISNCPSNLVLSVDAGSCGAVVGWPSLNITDNCGIDTIIASADSGDFFSIGITQVVIMAQDASGNVDSCSFTVTITDDENPVITCPGDTLLSNDIGSCGAIFSYPISSSDNCTGDTLIQISGLASGSLYPIGTTTNTFVATDSTGNTDTCSFTVTIMDLESPVLNCPGDTILQNGSNMCGANYSYAITATDNCPGDSIAQIQGLASGSIFPIGVTLNEFIVTDSAGNTDTCSFSVTVIDTTTPAILCPSSVNLNNDSGQCGAIVTYSYVVTDNCGLQDTTLISGLPSGSLFPIGTTTNTIVVTDSNGNVDTCSFDIEVLDVEAPTFVQCPGDTVLPTDSGMCSALINYSVQANDNCGVDSLFQISGLASGSNFPKGVTQNIWVAIDSVGNTDTCSFSVTVEDLEHPMFTQCPSDTVLQTDSGLCTANFAFSYSASDNCGIDSLYQLSGLSAGSDYPTGITTNILVAIDSAGNTDTCSFTVEVIDDNAPTIQCPSDTVISTDSGMCGAIFSYATPVGTDACPGSTTLQLAGKPSGETFSVGSTLNTFEVTDAFGLTSSCSFNVEVRDDETPSIICPADIATCDSIILFDDPIVEDNCKVSSVKRDDFLSVTSGDIFPEGTLELFYLTTDSSGNESRCSFEITRYPTPVVVAAHDTTTDDITPVTLLADTSKAVSVTWSPPDVIDHPDSIHPTVSIRTTTSFVITATSEEGCTASDSIVVFVNEVLDLDVATLFTPNGDGRNDTWKMNKIELIDGCEVAIYNQWGTRVFESTGYDNQWDGMYQGQPLPEATYYYVVTCQQEEYTGPITLIRLKK